MRLESVFLVTLFCATFANPVIQNHEKHEHLLGTKKCTWGPTYWCGSLRTAKVCGATKHCIQAVWEHQRLPEDNDDVCNICKKMVKEARDQLLSNETQEELKEVFEGSCRLIPLKVISDECITFVDEFIPELVETLASEMNPTVVCTVAGLCNNARIDKMLETFKSKQRKPDVSEGNSNCEECHKFTEDMIANLHAHSKDEVLDKLLQVCGHMSSLSDGCKMIVTNYFDKIYDLSKQLTVKNFCDLLRMCDNQLNSKTESGIQVRPKSGVGELDKVHDLPCDFCKKMVIRLRDMLISNTTEEEFKLVLEGICRHLGNFKDECLGLVEQYYSLIYEYFVNDMIPEELCHVIGLCWGVLDDESVAIWRLVPAEMTLQKSIKLKPAKKIEKALTLLPAKAINSEIKLLPLDPAQTFKKEDDVISYDLIKTQEEQPKLHHVQLKQEEFGVRMANLVPIQQLPIKRLLPKTLIEMNRISCVMCEYVFHYLQNILMNQTEQEEIKKAVDGVCKLMPDPVQDQCVDFIEKYGDAIMVILAQDIDPSQVCPLLHLCPDNSPQKANSGCAICEFVITKLDNILKDKENEVAIRNALDKVCTYLPKNIADQCKDFVDTYVDMVIEMIVSDFTPEEVCAALKLCKPGKVHPTEIESNEIPPLTTKNSLIPLATLKEREESATPTKKFNKKTLCNVCQLVMMELKQMLKNNATTEELEKFLETSCSYLTPKVAEVCERFIENYGEKIIQLFEEMDPDAVCVELDLCLSGKTKVTQSFHFGRCDACEMVVKYLDKLLQDGSFQQNLDHILEKVCKYVPGKYGEECKELIELYGPYIVSVLGQLADSKKVCQALDLCPRINGHVHLLGGEKCTWGPTYWCQTEFHAKACQALTHCREEVWKADLPKRN